MKKLLSMLLALSLVLALALSFVGCNAEPGEKGEECTEHIDENDDGKCDKCKESISHSGVNGAEENDDNGKDDEKEIDNESEEKIPTSAEIGKSSEGLEFELNEDGESYKLVGLGTCTDSEVIISTYNGKPVTVIGEFSIGSLHRHSGFNSETKKITLGADIKVIERYAFYDAYALENITVCSDNVYLKSVDGNVYSKDGTEFITYAPGKISLAFEIPSTVTKIKSYSFMPCHLVSLTIPESVEIIEEYSLFSPSEFFVEVINFSYVELNEQHGYFGKVHKGSTILNQKGDFIFAEFEEQTWLLGYIGDSTEITLPKDFNGNEYEIAMTAFMCTDKITSVTIPLGKIIFGQDAFRNCISLEKVVFEEGNTKVGYAMFAACENLKEIVLPSSLEYISAFSFEYCKSLKSIVIPDGVTRIGSSAFYGCSNLTIYCEAESLPGGWDYDWDNGFDGTIVWGYTGE